MSGIEELGETKVAILMQAAKPISYSELKRQVAKSDPTLQKHLEDLREAGYIQQKEKHGPWQLTNKGRKALGNQETKDIDEAIQLLLLKIHQERKAEILVKLLRSLSLKDIEDFPELKKALTDLIDWSDKEGR